MSSEKSEEVKETCFVVMGFGKKTDFETGRTLDLDKTYKGIIKPAVEAAGLKCIRADEIEHSGVIDVPMYELLLNARVVVADLSTSNKNAFYELGVRHALKPYTTIILCEDGIKSPLPFDLNHVVIRMYHHLGEDIGFSEATEKQAELTSAIKSILSNETPKPDSPVYTFINGLTVSIKDDGKKDGVSLGEAVAEALGGASAETGAEKHAEIRSVLMEQVDEAQGESDFETARALLSRLRKKMKEAAEKEAKEAAEKGIKDIPERPEDPYIIQRLALVTYKGAEKKAKEIRKSSPQLTPEDESEIKEIQQKGYEEARTLLKTLDPETSNDTETLGLWGAVHKRLWELTRDRTQLDEAVRGYERGFYLRNDYYNGINLAYLLNVRAANAASRAEAIADFVQAERVRREVISICEALLKREDLPKDDKYWAMASLAEAYVGIGDEAHAQQKMQEAFAGASAGWMKESTEEQATKLRQLMSDSPLKYVRTDA
jgi:tetratricopeptide (TPR) repeat protein